MNPGDTGYATIQMGASGRLVAPLALEEEDVSVLDIALHLSNLCRFTGGTREFYSVGQHSVLCSRLVPPEHALAALFHDAPEAYINDLSGPIKRDTHLGRVYKDVENGIAAVIERALGLPAGAFEHPEVKRADWDILQVEGRQLMPPNDWARSDILEDMRITPWAPRRCRREFVARFEELS